MDQDRLMLVRADLAEQLDALRLTSYNANPVQFLMRLESIRKMAQSYRFDAVAEIASAFEESMQQVQAKGGEITTVENFTRALDEAIGCNLVDHNIAEALLANVAMRLHG